MSNNFIFNMGYDTSHVTSVLGREKLSPGSKVILVTPEEQDERQRNAIDDIDNYLQSLDFRVSLEQFRTGKSFQEDILNFIDVFSNTENLKVSLSGGPRDSLIALTVAANLVRDEIDEVFFRSDLNSELEELDLPGIGFDFDKKDRKILKHLEEKNRTADSLIQSMDLSQSTVYRRLKSLKKQKLVEKDTGGYRLTVTGKIAVRKSDELELN